MMLSRLKRMVNQHTKMALIYLKLVLNTGKVTTKAVSVIQLKDLNQGYNQAKIGQDFLIKNYQKPFLTKTDPMSMK